MKIQLVHSFEEIISLENLLLAWQEFTRGKRHRQDVQIFTRDLMSNIILLHQELVAKTYRHGGYESFFINDPKRRHIHKASVRDRLVHHAIYRILYPFFDRIFIADSFSCRLDKGTHKALSRFRAMAYQVSKNHTRTCWVLKCDIRKFFASIDHRTLLNVLEEYIPDKDVMCLLTNVIESYTTDCHPRESGDPVSNRLDSRFRGNDSSGVGLPLGNLTSQLFANVYMNVFDQWVKHKLKAKHYIRYADDFVVLSDDKSWLENLIPSVRYFLSEKLKLILHPNKIFLQTVASGVDFLGWINFSDHCVLRTTTKRRMIRRLQEHSESETLQSYLGLLKHGNTLKLKKDILQSYWLWN